MVRTMIRCADVYRQPAGLTRAHARPNRYRTALAGIVTRMTPRRSPSEYPVAESAG